MEPPPLWSPKFIPLCNSHNLCDQIFIHPTIPNSGLFFSLVNQHLPTLTKSFISFPIFTSSNQSSAPKRQSFPILSNSYKSFSILTSLCQSLSFFLFLFPTLTNIFQPLLTSFLPIFTHLYQSSLKNPKFHRSFSILTGPNKSFPLQNSLPMKRKKKQAPHVPQK